VNNVTIWVVILYSVVQRYQIFGGTCCLHLQVQKNTYFLNMSLHFLDKLSKNNSAYMGKNAADIAGIKG
jgi:hypothetical protein